LSRLANLEPPRAAGFTLVEALAALAIMAAGLAAIGELAASSLGAGLRTRGHLAQIAAAQGIMTGLPKRDALPFGRLTGSLYGHQWRIDAVPVTTSFLTGGSTPWRPQGVVLLVRSPSGATIEIDGIRLHKETPK